MQIVSCKIILLLPGRPHCENEKVIKNYSAIETKRKCMSLLFGLLSEGMCC